MVKGDNVRQEILNKAKELFATRGYSNTKMKDITSELGYQPSWISYYFKRKAFLVDAIFRITDKKIAQRITDRFGQIDDPLLNRYVFIRLIHRIFHQDEEAFLFRYEVSKNNDSWGASSQRLEEIASEFISHYGCNADNQLLKHFVKIACTAFDISVIDEYESQIKRQEAEEMMLTSTTILANLLGISSDITNKLKKESLKIADSIDVSDIHLLK